MSADTQVCRLCDVEKSLPSFPKRAGAKSGRDRRCRACLAVYYQSRREEKLAYQRARGADPAVRERAATRQRARRVTGGAQDNVRRREHYEAVGRPQFQRRQELLNALKARPCTDCDGCFHPAAMDFDHVRGVKRYGIDANRVERADFASELAKCELRCANCHRLRHALLREPDGV